MVVNEHPPVAIAVRLPVRCCLTLVAAVLALPFADEPAAARRFDEAPRWALVEKPCVAVIDAVRSAAI